MLSNILFSNTLRLVGSATLNVGVIVLIAKVMLVFNKRSSLLVTRLNSSYNFTKIRTALEDYRIIFDLKIWPMRFENMTNEYIYQSQYHLNREHSKWQIVNRRRKWKMAFFILRPIEETDLSVDIRSILIIGFWKNWNYFFLQSSDIYYKIIFSNVVNFFVNFFSFFFYNQRNL